MRSLVLYHIPTFRSSRALWMYLELMGCYDEPQRVLPRLVLNEFRDVERFRNEKPAWLLEMNPNGKIPYVWRFLD